MKTKFYGVIALMSLLVSVSCSQTTGVPKIPGVDGPKVNVQDGKIIVSVGLENLMLPIGVDLPLSVKNLKESRVSVSPAVDGGTVLQAAFKLGEFDIPYFQTAPATTLANGNTVPFFPAGTFNARALTVEKAYNSTFYIGEKAKYLVVEVPLPEKDGVSINYGATYRLKVNNKQIGVVALNPDNAQGEGASLVIALSRSQIEENKEFRTILKHSTKKKYKNVLF